MGKLQELVDAEARAAEGASDEPTGDEPTGDEPTGDEPTVAAVEAPPFDPKKLEGELRRHEREMAKVLGEGWDEMKACDTCGGAGFVPADYVEPPPVVADEFAVACPACNGYGLRSTPSLREGNQLITCEACQGAGWRDRRQLEAIRAAEAYAAPPAYAPLPPQPAWNHQTQQWETPNGQPAYAPPPPAPVPPPA